MTVSMITCPSCRTLLFTDTVVCPSCRHVLDAERAALINLDDFLSSSHSEQITCRSCGEENQVGLVRCWNCSSFLREDIQEAYYEMLRSKGRSTYNQPSFMKDTESNYASAGELEDGDDDFELSGTYSLREASEAEAREGNPPPSNGSGPKPASPPPKEENQDQSAERRQPPEDDPNAEAHSVATGGDVLLDIALNEEKESEQVRQKREAGLKKRHDAQGPPAAGDAPDEKKKSAQARKKAQKRERKYGLWLQDVHQHSVNPQKLKLKPGSLEKQFEPMEVGASAEAVILVSLKKKPSLFGKKQKPEDIRKEVRLHLEAGKKKDDLPAPNHQFLEPEQIKEIKVVQPVVYVHESMFAGIPVFGEGRIAVRLPVSPDSTEHQFLSFWLTEFRKFALALEKYFQIRNLGILEGVPLEDPILALKCHYSEVELKSLDPEHVKFFEKDPSIKLELIGRRCEGCGLAISEEARRKEKIGGLNGKSIAKAKCPKCEQKFGTTSLYKIGSPDKKDDKAGKKAKKK